jgi:hypothetical protein
MQIINSVVLNKEVLGKNVKILVAFTGANPRYNKEYDGVATGIGTIGEDNFLVLDEITMINTKYIQTIEIIK